MLLKIASGLRGIVLESHAIEYAQYAYLSTQAANAAIDRPETAARSDAVGGPRRIACWATASFDDLIRPLQRWTRNLEVKCAGGSLIYDLIR